MLNPLSTQVKSLQRKMKEKWKIENLENLENLGKLIRNFEIGKWKILVLVQK